MLAPMITQTSKRLLFNINGIAAPALSRLSSRRYFSDDRPKTLQYQDKLGHLPVPDLSETMDKFLKTAEPHLTEQEFNGNNSRSKAE